MPKDPYASLKQGLVGAWIPSISGSGLLLPDLSGRGNNGVLTNMDASDWVGSGSGRALDFDGVNDVVEAGRIDLANTGTVAAWIRRSANAGGIIIKQSVTQDQWDFALYFFQSKLYLYGDSLSPSSVVISPANLPSEWCHVAGVKTNSTLSLFVNGVFVASESATGSFQQRNFSTYIGYDFRDPAVRGSVQIDDARIYNRALTESEIKLLASKRGIGLQPSPTKFIAKQQVLGTRRRRILTGQT